MISGEHAINGRTTTFEFVEVRPPAKESPGVAQAIHNKHRSLNPLCKKLPGVISYCYYMFSTKNELFLVQNLIPLAFLILANERTGSPPSWNLRKQTINLNPTTVSEHCKPLDIFSCKEFMLALILFVTHASRTLTLACTHIVATLWGQHPSPRGPKNNSRRP